MVAPLTSGSGGGNAPAPASIGNVGQLVAIAVLAGALLLVGDKLPDAAYGTLFLVLLYLLLTHAGQLASLANTWLAALSQATSGG